MLKQFFYYRPFADRTLCHFLKQRLSLPYLDLQLFLEEFDQHPIILHQFPKGDWSTPLSDIVMLLKLVVCTKPKRLLEIGSFRGYTALYLAQHTAPDAEIVTVDCDPNHGEAYRDTSYAAKIERRVGMTSATLFETDLPGSYDFVFIDANHSYAAVKHDTELILPFVAPNGFLVWHDYANWGYFNGKNGVPEYLGELSTQLAIAHIIRTDLAIHSPAWSGLQKTRYQNALQAKRLPTQVNTWETTHVRG